MAAFPGGTPVFTGFTSSHTLAQDSHAAQHNLEQAEIVALANKLGTGASTPAAGQVLRGTGAGTSGYGPVSLTSDVTGILPVGSGGIGQASLTGLTLPAAILSASPVLTTPVIASFTTAQHDHTNAAGGGALGASSVGTTQLAPLSVTAAKIETQEAWINVTYQNSWIDYDTGTWYPGSYYKDSLGIVHLRGLVKNGTMGSNIFTLPAGYRPSKQILFSSLQNNASGRLDVTAGGGVVATAGLAGVSNAFVQLDNVHFKAEQ